MKTEKDLTAALNQQTTGPKFIRRSDLTVGIRTYLAVRALLAITLGQWGVITALSREYSVSRTFIYMLCSTLKMSSSIVFGVQDSLKLTDFRAAYRYILSLRLEGKSSIEDISSIMKRFDIDKSSVGSVSQSLKEFGSLLPNTLTAAGEIQITVFASDELFAKQTPILITVDPISSAILRIELSETRKAEDWKKHWLCLEENGCYAAYLVCDEGKGLCAGKEQAMPDVHRQSDTYHAIAHVLGHLVCSLENAAYKAIELEDKCSKKLNSARSNAVLEKRFEQLEKAAYTASEKIELYDKLSYLYQCLIEERRIFDDNGSLRNRQNVLENIESGLELIETLDKDKLTKAVKKIRRTLPDLLHYFVQAEKVVGRLKQTDIEQDGLQALFIAWQWNKAVIKSKKAEVTRYCASNETSWLDIAEGYLQNSYKNVKELVYNELDNIVQSSALVECINSIIRPYLNTSKNHITQESLNLIMFYHNHRRYKAGKRKNKTPMEILTGKKQKKDWIELLLDIVEQKNPAFFSC